MNAFRRASEESRKQAIAMYGSEEKAREVLAWPEKNAPSLIERGHKELGVSKEAIAAGLEAYCRMTVLRTSILRVLDTLAEGHA